MTNTAALSNWKTRAWPGAIRLEGRYATLTPYDQGRHLDKLFAAIGGPANEHLWDYIPMGPYPDAAALGAALEHSRENSGWRTMVIEAGERVMGMASFMRIRPEHGSAEVGCVVFSPELQRTRAATDALFLFGFHLFDELGYRRFEWKCNNANEASKRAAVRFGFRFEGVFRNDMVVKGENRDTAWYAMTDADWPSVRHAFEDWLAADNFDANGIQRTRLRAGD